MARERAGRKIGHGCWTSDPALADMLAAAEPLGPPPLGRQPAVLTHGDLNLRHLLLNFDATAAGVIDWGEVCVADPAVDLSMACAGLTGAARAALLAAYGPVPADRELRARALAAMLCAALADYAAAQCRTLLLAESLAGLRRSHDGRTG
jgi:aminoglycoside phosphotransferase (APT) family kinase protein